MDSDFYDLFPILGLPKIAVWKKVWGAASDRLNSIEVRQ